MKTDQQRQPHWPQMWCIEDPRRVFVCYLMILPKAVWRWPFSTLGQTRIREMFVRHCNILVRKIVTRMTWSVCLLQSFKERRFWGRRGNRISLSIQINPTAWLSTVQYYCLEFIAWKEGVTSKPGGLAAASSFSKWRKRPRVLVYT